MALLVPTASKVIATAPRHLPATRILTSYFVTTTRFQHTTPFPTPVSPPSSSSSPESAKHIRHHKEVFPTPLQSNPESFSTHSFQHFRPHSLHPSVVTALSSTDKHIATLIQRLSVPKILSPSNPHVLIASETGSGKTLAYLIPLLSKLKANEKHLERGDGFIISSKLMSPSILVLQPTRELTYQAHRVAKELSHFAQMRVRAAAGGKRRGFFEAKLENSAVDVLVATPGAVNRLVNAKKLFLSDVKSVVIDEADELLEAHNFDKKGKYIKAIKVQYGSDDDSHEGERFGKQMGPILKKLKTLDHHVQHVYVAATVPSRLERWIREWHQDDKDNDGQRIDFEMVRGIRLHTAAGGKQNVKTVFIRVDGSEGGVDDSKMRKVSEIISMACKRKDAGKMMIFCDGFERREYLCRQLNHLSAVSQAGGIVHLGSLNRTDDDDDDDYNVRVKGNKKGRSREDEWDAFREGKVKIGVCAKSFGRGIDDQDVRTVMLVDVPMTGSEYLHRVGRIRNGGRVYVLVGGREEARAEALFLGCIKGERVAGVEGESAWEEKLEAGKDRIESESVVRRARKDDIARWVDERASKIGTFKGRKGRGVGRVERRIAMVPESEKYRGVVMGKMNWPKKPKKNRYN